MCANNLIANTLPFKTMCVICGKLEETSTALPKNHVCEQCQARHYRKEKRSLKYETGE